MTPDEYCINVCRAKCCHLHEHKISCPKLGQDCRCTIYKERFAPDAPQEQLIEVFETERGTLIPFICSRIEKLIENKILPSWIEDGCCYAHPELLDINEAK